VTNTGEPGTTPAAPTKVVVGKSKVAHAKLAGLHFGPRTSGLLAERNTALDNGPDCQDVSPAGTRAPASGTLMRSDPVRPAQRSLAWRARVRRVERP
jgi:hypothetical protein